MNVTLRQLRVFQAVAEGRTFVAGCDSILHVVSTDQGKELAQVDLGGQAGASAAVDGTHGQDMAQDKRDALSRSRDCSFIVWVESSRPTRSAVGLEDSTHPTAISRR